MPKIHFNGPEGAPFAGHTLDAMDVTTAGLDALAALQRGTKLRMTTIMSRLRRASSRPDIEVEFLDEHELEQLAEGVRDKITVVQDRLRFHLEAVADEDGELEDGELEDPSEIFATQVALFLTLWGSGFKVSWPAVTSMSLEAFEQIDDEPIEDDETPALEEALTVDPQLPATDSPQAVAVAEPTPALSSASSLQ